MAIVPLKKIGLFGTIAEKATVLAGLQSLGCVHLVNLTPGTGEGRPLPGFSAETHDALKYLHTCPIQSPLVADAQEFDFPAVMDEALQIRQREQKLNDEGDFLVKAIDTVKVWGDFDLPSEGELPGLQLWFYVVPHYRREVVERSELVWQAVGRDDRFEYIVVVHPDKPENMPVSPRTMDPRSLSLLTHRHSEVEQELDSLHQRRIAITQWYGLMVETMLAADDQATLRHATEQTFDESRIFAVGGWAPVTAVRRLESFAKRNHLALRVQEPGPDDTPPTLLKNPSLLASGEQTLTFYMTPGYRTWDPSVIVLFSFATFFAMILADAGYALILAVALGLMWSRLGRARNANRVRNLFLILVIASLAYGVIVGSYFGTSPPERSVLASLQVLDMKDQGAMMKLSIVVGGLHLILANLAIAWRYWRAPRAFASLGWVAIILGGLIAGFEAFGENLPGVLLPIDVVLLAGGAMAVVIFSSNRPLSGTIGGLVRRLLEGVISLAGISKAFGDVLSYLRLFALGLASSQLAVMFNEIAGTTSRLRGVGFLLALLILVFGHSLNLLLAVIGGVVHGLRLNCIEFLGWGLPEEGYSFQAFCRKASQ